MSTIKEIAAYTSLTEDEIITLVRDLRSDLHADINSKLRELGVENVHTLNDFAHSIQRLIGGI